MALIETTAGSVTTRGSGSMDVAVHYRRNAKSEEMLLHDAERDPKSEIVGIGGVEVTPSGAKLSNLKWVQKRNEFPDGAYLRINVRKTTTGLSFSRRVANVIIRVRGSGPLNELAVILPTDQHSARSRIYIIGRYDVLTPDEVAELGLDKAKNGADDSMTYDPVDGENEIFSLFVKERETAKRSKTPTVTKVQSKTGKSRVMPKLRMARRIGLRD